MPTLELLGFLGILLLVCTFFLNREWGFCAYVAMQPFILSGLLGFNSTTLIFMVVATFCAFIAMLVRRERPIVHKWHIPVFLFSSYLALQCLLWFTRDFSYGALCFAAVFLVLPFHVLFLPTAMPRSRWAEKFIRWYVIGSTAYFSGLLVLWVLGSRLSSYVIQDGVVRMLGLGETHPAYFTSGSPLLVACAFYYVVAGRGYEKALGVAAIASVFAVTVLSGSRGALVSGIVAVVSCVVLARGYRLRLAVALGLAVLGLGIFLKAMPSMSDRLVRFDPRKQLRTPESRYFEHAAAYALFREYPIFGVGPGGFRNKAALLVAMYAELDFPGSSRWMMDVELGAPLNVASTWLFYFVQTGLVGGILFGLVVGFPAWGFLRSSKEAAESERGQWSFLLAGWFAFLVHLGGIQGHLHPLTWLLVAVGTSGPHLRRTDVS